jgi:hypothetical protein
MSFGFPIPLALHLCVQYLFSRTVLPTSSGRVNATGTQPGRITCQQERPS